MQAKAQAGNVTPGDAAGYPILISQSGSYRLGSNLTVSANKIGLQITTPNVTIDLNGYTLDGANVATMGVFGNSVANAVTIENGTIQRFKQDGAYTDFGDYWTIEKVRVLSNGRRGIQTQAYSMFLNNTVVKNKSDGIVAGPKSVIQGNAVSNNLGQGITAASSAIIGNAAAENGGSGISGGDTSGYADNALVSNAARSVLPMDPNSCFGC